MKIVSYNEPCLRIHLTHPVLQANLMFKIGVKILLRLPGNPLTMMVVLRSPDTGLKLEIVIVGHGMLLVQLVEVNLGILFGLG